jgi:hypothetical protein
LLASAYKSHLDRKAELRKSREQTRHDYLDPLRVAANDLCEFFPRASTRVVSEKDIPQADLKENYHLRYWFGRCREYIVNLDNGWTDEERRRDFAIHSGRMGCEAASTLYYAGCYLYCATRIRLKRPYIRLGRNDHELIAKIDDVRDKFSQLAFYSVTQDCTGVSMRNAAGEMKNFREFGETITSKSEKAWFLTLADVFCNLHDQSAEHTQAFITSLEALIRLLNKSLHAKSGEN